MLLALLLLAQTAPAVPGEVHLVIPRRGCRVVLDGKPVAFDALPDRLKLLAEAGVEVHFQPDPRANARCVDKTIAVLKAVAVLMADSSPLKLGFIGNEGYRAEGKQ